VRIGEDGRAELTFVHASAYTMVLSSVSMAVDSAGNNVVSEIDPEQEDIAETNDSVKPSVNSVKPTEEIAGQTEVTVLLIRKMKLGHRHN
jgi:ribonucleotide reductase beta subunit family protein with ferritin-like domain